MPTLTASRSRARLALLAICLLALGLRALGIAYGLPGVYNPDETPILNRALALAQDLKPQAFVYPSLYFYLLFIWEGLFFVAGRVVGLFDSLGEFQRQFFVDPSAHFLVGRAFSVLCGVLTVVAVYLLGRRLFNRTAGLLGAAAMAVSPIAVRDAHYVKLDVPTTMFVAFAHVALARIVVDAAAAARRRTWVIAGFIAGLAVSTQYYAIFLGFTMIAVALADLRRSHDWRQTGRLFLWSTAAAAAGFLAGSPYVPFALPQVISDVAHVREVDIDRAAAGGSFTAVLPYLRILLWDAMGWPIWIAAAAGFIWTIASDWRRGLVLASFFVTFYLFIANTVPMSRYLNVVLPLVAAAAGFTIMRLVEFAANPVRITLLVTLPFIPGLVSSLEWDMFLRMPDTRALAGSFIEQSLPPGASLLVQPYGPPLRQSREGLLEALRAHLGSEAHATTKFQLMLGLDPYPQPAYRLIYFGDKGLDKDKIYVLPQELVAGDSLDPLRQRGIEYVVLKRGHLPNPETAGLESALEREGRRIAGFSPYHEGVSSNRRAQIPPFLHNTAAVIHPELERPGPIVEIWKVEPPAPEGPAGSEEAGADGTDPAPEPAAKGPDRGERAGERLK